MQKPILDTAGLERLMNRGQSTLGPGHIRVNADDAEDKAEVLIFGDIGGWWDGVNAEEFAKEIAALDVGNINVRLNSPGGVVFDGVAIYNALARHKARVVIDIEGIAASIASVIAMAGDEIRIAEGSHLMIHKPWSFVIGDEDEMRKEADVLATLKAGIIDIYEARTDQKRAQIEQWVNEETWFRGQAAVDAGFADVMVPAKKKEKKAHARSAMLPLFIHAPQDILAGQEDPAIREFENLLRDVEGCSKVQAKRIAALASKVSLTRRDDEEEPPTDARRDDGGGQAQEGLSQLASFIRAMTA